MNLSKRFVLLKSNLKLQISKHETAKQKIIILMQSFQRKFIILCPERVSRNLPVPRNLRKSSLNLPNRHKKSNWPKSQKKQLYSAFSKDKKSQRCWKSPKITNLASTKSNWQPCSRIDISDELLLNNYDETITLNQMNITSPPQVCAVM